MRNERSAAGREGAEIGRKRSIADSSDFGVEPRLQRAAYALIAHIPNPTTAFEGRENAATA